MQCQLGAIADTVTIGIHCKGIVAAVAIAT